MILKDKIAFITGGTGAIGEKLCEIFSLEGADVAFNYEKNEKKAEKVLETIKKNKRQGLAFKCSVLDSAGIEKMIEEVITNYSRIDILVNSAGITQVLPFPLIDEQDWDRMMEVNIKGMFLVTKEVVRRMIPRKRGVIINIGSIAGMRLLEVPVHYAASKSAVIGFTISLAKELARYNIRVNNVVPGMLDAGVGTNVPEKQYKEYLKYCAAGRPGKPEEIAHFAAFLCSDKAKYINAQNMIIDGGL